MDRQAEKLLRQAQAHREIGARRSAVSDLISAIGGAGIVRIWGEILAYLRRLRMLRIILQVLNWLVALLQAGTLIVLTTAVFFVLIPLLVLLLILLPLVTLLDRHSSEKRLAAAFADSREAVFLFPSGAGTAKTARDLAADGTRTVLLISPYWLTSRDASGQPGRRYVNLRQEQAHVFCIRRSFFFRARRLAQEQGLELTVVY